MIFKQLYDLESSTYTYILADSDNKEGIIIDTVKENVERDLKLISELGIKLVYSLETHIHADHITGTKDISLRTGAKTVAPWTSKVECADILIKDGDVLSFGKHQLRAIYTPGHTNTCMSYLVEDMIFTGDALLIRGTGRTDFQSGSAKALYHSISDKLYSLPDYTIVYPGHDYKGLTASTIGEEKLFNQRINSSVLEEDFIKTMSNLKLANPKKIQEAVPANLQCGTEAKKNNDSLPDDCVLIDVRSLDEHHSGTIPNALSIPHDKITENLSQIPRDKEVVLFCRSGNRSAKAKETLLNLGYQNIRDIEGGFTAWAQSGKPIHKARKAIPIQRQVMIAAGSLITLAISLGYFINEGFYGLAVFVGLGLIFAGISGFCGLALLIERLPWNKISSETSASAGRSCSTNTNNSSCSV